MTDFLNPKDDRIKQLDDETWALFEWIDKEEPKEAEAKSKIEESPQEIQETETNRVFFYIKQYYWVFLLALICIVGAILMWIFK
jgi:hypothetical protein